MNVCKTSEYQVEGQLLQRDQCLTWTHDSNTEFSNLNLIQYHHPVIFFFYCFYEQCDWYWLQPYWGSLSQRVQQEGGGPLRLHWLHVTANSHESHFYVFPSLIHISFWSENGNTSPPYTHTNGSNRKVTVTINTPFCSPGSASVLQTNQPAAWTGGGRSRRKEKVLSVIYRACAASASLLASFYEVSNWRCPPGLQDFLTCPRQRLTVCRGKSAATCFLSGFTLIAFWLNTR